MRGVREKFSRRFQVGNVPVMKNFLQEENLLPKVSSVGEAREEI